MYFSSKHSLINVLFIKTLFNNCIFHQSNVKLLTSLDQDHLWETNPALQWLCWCSILQSCLLNTKNNKHAVHTFRLKTRLFGTRHFYPLKWSSQCRYKLLQNLFSNLWVPWRTSSYHDFYLPLVPPTLADMSKSTNGTVGEKQANK